MNVPLDVILAIASVAVIVFGYFFRQHESKISKLEAGLSGLKLGVATDYAKKTDMDRLERAVFDKLDRIEQKQDNLLMELSKKQDRHS